MNRRTEGPKRRAESWAQWEIDRVRTALALGLGKGQITEDMFRAALNRAYMAGYGSAIRSRRKGLT